MELDDLKQAWKIPEKLKPEAEDRDAIIRIIHRSGKGIARMIVWEGAIAVVMFSFFAIVVIFFNDRISLFHYKLVVPIVLYAIPVYYRLYRSLQFLRNLDFSRDIRSTLKAFVGYYSTTLRFYRWGSYVALIFLLVIFLTDEKFLAIDWWIQAMVVGYLLLAMAVTGPFVKRMYGSKVRDIESYLKEETKN